MSIQLIQVNDGYEPVGTNYIFINVKYSKKSLKDKPHNS